MKHKVNIFGRRHIHDHVRALAIWQQKRNPSHTIADEYDRLIVAGVKALYNQDLPLNPAPKDAPAQPPAPEVASHA